MVGDRAPAAGSRYRGLGMEARMEDVSPGTEPDVLAEARRLLEAARARAVTVRLIGGAAIGLKCPSAASSPLARPYKDLDFVGLSRESRTLQELFASLGYTPDRRFNALHGHRRLRFRDDARARLLDVLLDRFEMCHRFDLRDRLPLDPETLPAADLLLTKMQVVEANEKDLVDALALLADHPITDGSARGIDAGYVAQLCARDWGLWRTLQLNRGRLEEYAERLEPSIRGAVVARLDELFHRIDREPKSMAWKLRARIGDRVRWYELPEEVG